LIVSGKAFHWCDFEFDSEMFPDPKAQIARLKSSGKCCKQYLGQIADIFRARQEGLCLGESLSRPGISSVQIRGKQRISTKAKKW